MTLNDAGIRLPGPDYKWISLALTGQSDVRFPHQLLPGKSCSAWIGFRELACGLKTDGYAGLIRLIAFYPEQAGRKYGSKPYAFDVDEWARPAVGG